VKKQLCKYPGCNSLANDKAKYCDKHKPIMEQKESHRMFQFATSPNLELYHSYKWFKLRKEVLQEQAYCSRCGLSKEETTLHAHHMIPPRGNEDLFFNKNNVTVLCEGCHNKTTQREMTERRSK
jgi:5-methylcytosine-specific restriction endonuclease McrA